MLKERALGICLLHWSIVEGRVSAMFRRNWKSLLVGAVVAITLVTAASQAKAWWGWGCYRPVSWNCAPYTTVSYDPCYYSTGGWYLGWRPGPIRRLLFGPYRWYYAGWGGYTAGYWASSSYDACCPTVAGQGTVQIQTGVQPTPAKKPALDTTPAEPEPPLDTTPVEPKPKSLAPPAVMPPATTPPAVTPPAVTPPAVTPPPVEPPLTTPSPFDLPGTSDVPTRANSALLTVWVPYDAKVFVNGLATRSTGSRRQYVSFGLKPGFSYKYTIRAQVIRGGQLIEDVRTVALTAGQRTAVAFGFNPMPNRGLASAR